MHKIQEARLKREQLKMLSVLKVEELYNIKVTDDEADSILLGSAFLMKEKPE